MKTEKLTFDELPDAIQSLINEVAEIKKILIEKSTPRNAPKMDDKYLQVNEVAKKLGCSKTNCYYLIKRGLLEGAGSNPVYVSIASINAYIDKKESERPITIKRPYKKYSIDEILNKKRNNKMNPSDLLFLSTLSMMPVRFTSLKFFKEARIVATEGQIRYFLDSSCFVKRITKGIYEKTNQISEL